MDRWLDRYKLYTLAIVYTKITDNISGGSQDTVNSDGLWGEEWVNGHLRWEGDSLIITSSLAKFECFALCVNYFFNVRIKNKRITKNIFNDKRF